MTVHRLTAALVAATIVMASCGVPTGPDSFEAVDPEVVPDQLAQPSTTTSTTTTTMPAPTTMPPDDQSNTVVETTTTVVLVPTVPVQVFFVSRGRLSSVETAAPVAPEPFDLILLLERGPEGPLAGLLDNLVSEGLIIETTRQGGVLTVELDETALERIANRDEVEAIGQIVLTFLEAIAGIGQIAFTIDGDPLTVPTADGVFTAEPVSRDDYSALLADTAIDGPAPAESTTTTSTTTTVATTVPPSTVAPS